ncbi:hypothetical protein [Alkaliphilus serpentinus]|uniref:Uncharacterized protein n=1 Tax=Alkaliphilus serpentinus TaxID=1482731 RepID=A0A833HQ91_9FIRM|nr:hypothetical protein [Alkaliphilus serpentinus]KAB3531574.1 hypothetical protein F8153_05210 [Alkaliphilus serpentinus]
MEEKVISLKACFKGILSDLLILVLKLSLAFGFFLVINGYKNTLYNRYDIGFRSSLVNPLKTDISLTDFVLLYLTYIILVILLSFLLYVIYKIISLLVKVPGKTTIDFAKEKIIIKKNISPFTKIDEEILFYKIIEAGVRQNLLQRILETGDLYMEYLVLSETDSHIRGLEIKYISSPYQVKKKLL